MATFRGLNTIGQVKKFTLTDFDLIKRDLLNAFLIRAGSMPGRPDVGTEIWNYVFDPLVDEILEAVEAEITKIINGDPRLNLESLTITSSHNTVIAEVAVTVLPNQSVENMSLVFDQNAESLNIV